MVSEWFVKSVMWCKWQFCWCVVKNTHKSYTSIYLVLIENKPKFFPVHASSGFKHSLREVLQDPAVQARLADTKAAEEVSWVWVSTGFGRFPSNENYRFFVMKSELPTNCRRKLIQDCWESKFAPPTQSVNCLLSSFSGASGDQTLQALLNLGLYRLFIPPWLQYRVLYQWRHVDSNLLLTSKQKFCFSMRPM